jgi:GxxExxY protein
MNAEHGHVPQRARRRRPDLQDSDVTDRILRAFFDVHTELGGGFLESVYHRAMEIALRSGGIEVQREPKIPVWFRGEEVGVFEPDLLVGRRVVVELKTVAALNSAHVGQVINYLRATSLEVGLLLNFGPSAEFRRLILRNERKPLRVTPRNSAVR